MGAETEKKKVAEEIWMNYLNEYLFKHGMIDEKMRNQLKIKISTAKKL